MVPFGRDCKSYMCRMNATDKHASWHPGNSVTWSIIYGAGMGLILRQCALCGKSHDGLGTSCGVLGPPAGAATMSGICRVYGGVLHCIWTPFGLCNHFAICLASPDASEVCAVCNDVQPKKEKFRFGRRNSGMYIVTSSVSAKGY